LTPEDRSSDGSGPETVEVGKPAQGADLPHTDPVPEAPEPSTLHLSLVGLITRLVLLAITLLNTIVLARSLGPAGLGRFFVFYRIVGLLAIIADGGMTQSAASFFGRASSALPYLHGVMLRILPLFTLLTVAGAAVIFAVAGEALLPGIGSELLLVGFAAVPFVLYAQVGNNMLAGMGKVTTGSVVQILGNGTWLVLTALFVGLRSGGVEVAAVVYAAAMVVQATALAVSATRLIGRPTLASPSAGTMKDFVTFGWRAYPGTVVYLLWIRLPVFLLNKFHGPASVGLFSAGQQLAERVTIPIQAVQQALYRSMSRLGRVEATAAFNRFLRFCWIGMGVIALVGILIVDPLIPLLLGERYAATIPVTRLLLVGALFLSVSLLLDAYFLNQLRRPGLLSILAFVNAGLSIVLGFLLIPAFREQGAAVAVAATQIIGTAIYLAIYRSKTRSTAREMLIASSDDLARLRGSSMTLLARVRGR
jgi:O-antigen/teichoic acid export membrane protein